MRSWDDTRQRWQITIAGHTEIDSLRAACRQASTRKPCELGLRSICWKVFLIFQGLNTEGWPKIIEDSRSAYTALKEHYTKGLFSLDGNSDDDPLSDNENSPWNTLRQDEELRAEILQDVERCMSEQAYFRESSTQAILLDILFVYCKLNRDIGYRQGMHEVLAPLLYVVAHDAIEVVPNGVEESNELMQNCLNNAYVEHDAFTLFGAVMQTAKGFYETGNSNETTNTGLLNHSPIVERSKRIHENFLHHADPELAEHLAAIEILPQIFLIRWVRLLFGREFPFDDVLTLWDLLFAEDPTLELIDLICVSMLLRIRWQRKKNWRILLSQHSDVKIVLEADYTGALTLLLRYPVPESPHGPSTFVSDAIYLRENLLLDGGDHIISKYSRKSPETTVTRKLPRKIKRARTEDREAARKALIPSMSPSRFIQEQGGIEQIIQEAAKNVYQQGERWGVGKALKGAVQTIQNAGGSPRRREEGQARWSLDNGRTVSDVSPPELIAKVEALEQRNVKLAEMLKGAIDEMWTCQRTRGRETAETESEALGIAIAKVQFVQVYLDNGSIALPEMDEGESRVIKKPSDLSLGQAGHAKTKLSPSSTQDMPDSSSSSSRRDARQTSSSTEDALELIPPSGAHADAEREILSSSSSSSPSHARPLLSQSAYSWMLGEEQRVPPLAFRDGNNTGRNVKNSGGRGSLFGESGHGGKMKQQAEEEEEDDDVFGGVIARNRRSR